MLPGNPAQLALAELAAGTVVLALGLLVVLAELAARAMHALSGKATCRAAVGRCCPCRLLP